MTVLTVIGTGGGGFENRLPAGETDQDRTEGPKQGRNNGRGGSMIINQSGVSAPFVFAGTGDEFVVSGVISNLGSLGTAVIRSDQAGNTITNAGQIASFGAGDAITLTGGGTVTNAGLIAGAIVSTSTLTFTNTGRFVGFVVNPQDGLSTGSVITNRGAMVFADGPGTTAHIANAVIALGASADTVINSGRVLGDIYLGDGADLYDGRGGSMLGTVHGGLGDDVYMLTTATALTDSGGIDTVTARFTYILATGFENLTLTGFGNFTGIGNAGANALVGNINNNLLQGLGGDDTLFGGIGADTLDGGTNNDSLDGQLGADRILGGYGNDTLIGGDGGDAMLGGTGSDRLAGGRAGDTLEGGIGADTLIGGEGNDVLSGGAFGTDVMTGGLGADTFAYVTASDSFATHAADVITDFEVGIDKIDLSALGVDPFLFMGSDPFSLPAASVRVSAGSASTTLVSIDLDGNTTTDMQIVLTGVLSLTAGDFIL